MKRLPAKSSRSKKAKTTNATAKKTSTQPRNGGKFAPKAPVAVKVTPPAPPTEGDAVGVTSSFREGDAWTPLKTDEDFKVPDPKSETIDGAQDRTRYVDEAVRRATDVVTTTSGPVVEDVEVASPPPRATEAPSQETEDHDPWSPAPAPVEQSFFAILWATLKGAWNFHYEESLSLFGRDFRIYPVRIVTTFFVTVAVIAWLL